MEKRLLVTVAVQVAFAIGAMAALGQTSPSGPTGQTPSAPGKPATTAQSPFPDFPGAALFNDRSTFLSGVKANHADLAYREDDRLSIEFTAERDAHLYLLYYQADGTSLLLFPNEAQTKNRVPANQRITLPAPGGGFRFRVGPPFGTEVLQVVATLAPAPELDGLVKTTGRAAAVAPEMIARLHERLKKDVRAWSEHRVRIQTVARQAEPPPRPARRAALLVGVSKLKANNQYMERYVNGIEVLSKAMLQHGGIEAGRMKTILGEDATRANIQEAITKWLPSVSQPGDVVFIYYVGHGGTVKNLDGTKPDGRDGFLTVYDNDIGRVNSQAEWEEGMRRRCITDAMLARWIQELAGRQVVLLLYTCHGGSMVDEDALVKFFSREAARVKGVSQLNTVVMASCFPDEETTSSAKMTWMAYYLSEAMAKLPHPVTLRQAFEYYREGSKKFLRNIGEVGSHLPLYVDNALVPIVMAP